MTTRRYIMVAALAALLALSGPARPAHADQNLGQWAVTCRAVWGNSTMTITFGSDGPWARQACSSVVDNPDSNNQWAYYPLDQPRPGVVHCAEIYTYGGYWLKERYPFTQGYSGAAQIAVRDDVAYDGTDLSATACGSVIGAADVYNENHGYNTSDAPLAPIQQCNGCGMGGGGGGGPVAGNIGQLPGSLKAKRPARKPKTCYTNKPTRSIPLCKK